MVAVLLWTAAVADYGNIEVSFLVRVTAIEVCVCSSRYSNL